ncbi:hypothetical protein M8J76_000065 [Diaphorina citri]|nr:hypothetical protein M8J76_000065 [Diaphorina citri]
MEIVNRPKSSSCLSQVSNLLKMLPTKKRYECPQLPPGWYREEVTRNKGFPCGKKLRTRSEVLQVIRGNIPGVSFDFRSGKLNSLQKHRNKQRGNQFEYCRGVRNDASLVPPIRQTASIFKQPVTVFKTQESKVKTEIKQGTQEKPKQLFWEKRLEGLRACDTTGSELTPMELPKTLKSVGPHVREETILQSIATALHVLPHPVTGQGGNKSNLEKSPGIFLNPEQPLIMGVSITEEDIKKQEEKVSSARSKLREALKRI